MVTVSGALGGVADLIISLSLAYFLRLHTTRGPKTKTRISIVKITMYAVNIGILSTIFSMAAIVTFYTPPSMIIWLIFIVPSGSLYVNSFLVSLNVRRRLQGEFRSARQRFVGSEVPGVPAAESIEMSKLRTMRT